MLQIEPLFLIHIDYYFYIKFVVSGQCILGGQYGEGRRETVGKRKDILVTECQQNNQV